jgi:hypothetical protein
MSWLKRLFGGVSGAPQPAAVQQAPPTAEEINQVVPAFGDLMARHAAYGAFGGAVFDEATLPVAKARLEFLLFCAIGIVNDEQQVNHMAAGLLHLADYQSGVGPVPVTLLPSLPDPTKLTDPDAVRAAAEAFSKHSTASRYVEFEARVQHDLVRLKTLADKALAIRATHQQGRK